MSEGHMSDKNESQPKWPKSVWLGDNMNRRFLLTLAFLAIFASGKAFAHYQNEYVFNGSECLPPTSDWVCARETAPCPNSHPNPHETLPWSWCEDGEGNYTQRPPPLEAEWHNMSTALEKRDITDYGYHPTQLVRPSPLTAGTFLFPDKERRLVFAYSSECGRPE